METKDGAVFKQRVTRYLDAAGSRVSADTPGASKVVVESKKWYGRLKIDGEWKLIPLSKDKGVARSKLAKLETDLARGEAGLIDPFKASKKTPIGEYVDAYLTDLKELGRSEKYLGQTRREIDTIVGRCEVECLKDLTADKVDGVLTAMTCSARTKNCYRQAVLGLCNYLVRKKKLAANPLFATTRRKGEKKRRRRALPEDALQKLLDAARQRPLREASIIRRGPRKGQVGARVPEDYRKQLERGGRHRALLYLTAILTGLRYKALRSLRVADLNLDQAVPVLEIPATRMKSKRAYEWPLHEALIKELRLWVAETGKQPDDPVFDLPQYSQTVKLLKKDLAAAGIPYQDMSGRYFDFHSLRKCTGSFLRQGNVDPSVSMRLLDHSDIRMTMEIYNDVELLDAKPALDAMPQLTIR